MTTTENDIKEKRFAAIEKNHLDLQKDVSNLAQEASALTEAVRGITSSISTLTNTQLTTIRTNWSVVFAGISVVVVVIGLVIYAPLTGVIEGHSEHIMNGHPETILRHIDNEVNNLETLFNRSQDRVHMLEKEVADLGLLHEGFSSGIKERVLDVERAIYAGASYRSGRPIMSPLENNAAKTAKDKR